MPAMTVETTLLVNFIVTRNKFIFYKTITVKDRSHVAKYIFYTNIPQNYSEIIRKY